MLTRVIWSECFGVKPYYELNKTDAPAKEVLEYLITNMGINENSSELSVLEYLMLALGEAVYRNGAPPYSRTDPRVLAWSKT